MKHLARNVVLGALAALILSAPAMAYVIVLKSGDTIIADKEYRIENGKAIIELPNGTSTFLDANEIDVEATRKANEEGYGKALVIEGGDARTRTEADSRPEEERRKSLADLAASRDGKVKLEPYRREQPAATPGEVAIKTRAGFVDLQSLPRRPFRDVELAGEMQRFFRGQGIDNVELYQGTQPSRPFAEITTNSEASVFRALEIAAEALLAVQQDHPDRVAALELLLATPERERAGQFVLTRDLAQDLVGDHVEVAHFFVQHVQF